MVDDKIKQIKKILVKEQSPSHSTDRIISDRIIKEDSSVVRQPSRKHNIDGVFNGGEVGQGDEPLSAKPKPKG